MQQNKILILIRHAHRNKAFGRKADNGISAKGRKQAKALARLYDGFFGKSEPRLYSSPKLRCIETLGPVAKQCGTEIEILEELNESGSDAKLRERVRKFDAFWRKSSAPLIVVSSHGDWIPAFVAHLTGVPIELDKGGWIQIEDGKIRWVIQRPEDFKPSQRRSGRPSSF